MWAWMLALQQGANIDCILHSHHDLHKWKKMDGSMHLIYYYLDCFKQMIFILIWLDHYGSV